MWQELRRELHPRGLEIVTVALDAEPEAARPWIEAARPGHPSLIDRAHLVDELFGIVNVPS
ncbi:MAG: TlpA family protein disulfide reductase, partial [Chloroflexota bacterium]|nr:TlpA family protein disulfide reductase [Chloroflexota bacterium]